MEPIITRTKGRQTVENAGRMIEVDEIVEIDCGKKGKTVVYIKPPCDRPVDYAGINRVAARYGRQLVMPEGAKGT